MRLRDLDAAFMRYEVRITTWTEVIGDPRTWESGGPTKQVTGPQVYHVPVETLAEAQSVTLQCPKCRKPDGAGHYMNVTFAGRGVPDDQGCHNTEGKPTRWSVSGTSLDDLTTRPSIQLQGGCNWHGYITNGDAK